MGNQWNGGKGDKNRTSNYRMYTSNYDNIFGTKAKATDDIIGEVDIVKGDTIMFKREGDKMRLVVIIESPSKLKKATGNVGHPFYVTNTLFEDNYRSKLQDV